MESSDSARKPRVDDKRVQDLALGMWMYPTVLAAYQPGLFRALDGKPRTPSGLAPALGIEERLAQAMLAACASLGLLSTANGRMALSTAAQDYLSERNPAYVGPFLDLVLALGRAQEQLRSGQFLQAEPQYQADQASRPVGGPEVSQ